MDIEHQIHFWLNTKDETLVAISMNRGAKDFSEQDRLALNLIRPHLVRAYKNIIINTRHRQEQVILESAIEEENKGLIQVDWDGKIHFITNYALQLLHHFFGISALNTNRLPLPLKKWLSTFQRICKSASHDHSMIFTKGSSALQIQYLYSSQLERPILLLKQIADNKPCSTKSAKSLGLTLREGEVLHWLAMGKTNQEIGIILNIRIGTVKKHLEHIYENLGVETRTAAAGVYRHFKDHPGIEPSRNGASFDISIL